MTIGDGKNLDSADHKSHMSYPKDGNYDGGRCPDTHPVHMATLFYETYYDTKGFKDMWYGDKQPFVLANGDATGYGYHGDFVSHIYFCISMLTNSRLHRRSTAGRSMLFK